MKKINTKPFELVGMTYEDYKLWCQNNNKKEKDVKSKKEFFLMYYHCLRVLKCYFHIGSFF